MPSTVDRVRDELASLGYRTSVFDNAYGGKVVSFDYVIEIGSRKGTQVTVGISVDEGYPESPPHWIHVTPPINDGKGGTVQTYVDEQGQTWLVMSRPPGDMWDTLPTKHMCHYIREHLRRIWKDAPAA